MSSAQALRTFRTARSAPPAAALCAVFAVLVVTKAARRPIVVRRIATARAVERRDVLKGHEDVTVQLDVGDVLDVAVRSEHAFLVLAAEERDLDLLPLVLVRIVLHAGGFSLAA